MWHLDRKGRENYKNRVLVFAINLNFVCAVKAKKTRRLFIRIYGYSCTYGDAISWYVGLF